MSGIERSVDDLGRIVLPIKYRKRLGICSNDKVIVDVDRGVITISPMKGVCALCGESVPEIMREIAEAMELPLTGNESGKELGEMCAAKCREIMRETNLPSIKALGHSREEMLTVANEGATSHLSSFCPIQVTREVAEQFALAVYDNYQ